MKYTAIKLLIIAITLTMAGCKEEANTTTVPSIKAVPKETQILFSEAGVARRNVSNYYYLIQGYDGIFEVRGFASCLETFKIEIGKPYNVKLNHVKDRPVVITDLCEMTAILKRDNSNM